MQHLVPYRYNTYTDTLTAVGYSVLIEHLYNVPRHKVILQATPAGFSINYPDNLLAGERNPFIQIRDKASRKISESIGPGQLWDKTSVQKGQIEKWWGTVSVINTLSSPDFNNAFYSNYTSDLGKALLTGETMPIKGSRSQLLYAQASKGVNNIRLSTTQGNIKADTEQVIAHLGYLYGAAGFIRDNYTITIVPRPSQDGPISLENYLQLVSFLRSFQPRASSEKILPTGDQTLPFFLSMMYFEFVEKLFDFLPKDTSQSQYRNRRRGVGRVIGSLDRMIYYKMGTSSAPFISDSLNIPLWLKSKPAISNVRDVVRNTLGENIDPNLLYLPVRTFAEGEPRLLFEFYRQYISLSTKKRLLEQKTIEYIMETTNYNDLACDAMKHFARAIRSRTLKKLYSEQSEPPDFALLTKLKSASLDSKRLINMLSEFIGSYNLRNARLMANGKAPEGTNLSYEDLQEIILLIKDHGAEFIVNTLMAQAMSKRSDESTLND